MFQHFKGIGHANLQTSNVKVCLPKNFHKKRYKPTQKTSCFNLPMLQLIQTFTVFFSKNCCAFRVWIPSPDQQISFVAIHVDQLEICQPHGGGLSLFGRVWKLIAMWAESHDTSQDIKDLTLPYPKRQFGFILEGWSRLSRWSMKISRNVKRPRLTHPNYTNKPTFPCSLGMAPQSVVALQHRTHPARLSPSRPPERTKRHGTSGKTHILSPWKWMKILL